MIASPFQHMSQAHRAFLAVFASVFTALLLFPFALAKTAFFREHSSYFYNVVIFEKYAIKGMNADILLVGDSALVTGLDPDVIEQHTGWTAYNLGVPISSFAVHQDSIVDDYLLHNSRPKIIVLYLSYGAQISGYDFDQGSLYESAITLLWHDSLKRNLEFYAHNPRRLFALSGTILRSFIGGFDASSGSSKAIHEQLVMERGFVPISNSPVLKPNELDATEVIADKQYITHFRRKYAKAGYRVVVSVSPVADCDPSFGRVKNAYEGLLDVQPYSLPCYGFSADGRFHMFRWAANENSVIFSNALKDIINSGTFGTPKRQRG